MHSGRKSKQMKWAVTETSTNTHIEYMEAYYKTACGTQMVSSLLDEVTEIFQGNGSPYKCWLQRVWVEACAGVWACMWTES